MIKRTLNPSDLVRIEKTIYDKPEKSDGTRILVMRFWPRGVKKTHIDTWMKELGTDKDLIKQWKSRTLSAKEFKGRYLASLKKNKTRMELVSEIVDRVSKGYTVTLLCSCKDSSKCHRSFLKEVIVGMVL